MELLLTVAYGDAGALSHTDVAIELDPFTSVALLCEALAAHGESRGLARAPGGGSLAVVRDGRPVSLDPETSVFQAGLVSGNEVRLVGESTSLGAGQRRKPPTPGGTASVSLDITSGPEAGRTVVIGPGRHVLGRSDDSDVVIGDLTLSRHHLTVEVSPALDVVVHPNPRATNGTFLGSAQLKGPQPLRPEEAFFAGSSQFVLRPVRFESLGTRDRLGNIAYNRGPYRQPIVRDRVLDELSAPPPRPDKRRFSIVAVIVPVLGAVAIVALTGQLAFLLLAGLGPLMVVANHFSEGRFSRRTYETDRQEFLARVEARAAEVDRALAEEQEERLRAAPDVMMLARQAAGRLPRLWERHRGAPDFLELRLGLGNQRTQVRVAIGSGGDPELREAAIRRLAHHDSLALVPVTASLDRAGVTGLHGDPEQVQALARALVLQAAALHSPEDLVIAAAVPATESTSWSWLKWLPHTRSATSPLEGPHLVHEGGADDLIRRLTAVVEARSGSDRRPTTAWPRVLLVLHERVHAQAAQLAALLDVAPQAGLVVLWAGYDQHQLPRHCRAIVGCVAGISGPSQLRFTDPTVQDQPFDLEGIPAHVATGIARSLAPVRDVSAASATTGIPRVVHLLDALELPTPSGAAVARRWDILRRYGLEGTLGVASSGPFAVDLVQHGPHTLVAGTSGSGKSELLQTLVLALAVQYPPARLNFLFIDYKGGASSADFRDLPHNVGSVTNLDERLSLRALASLRAELRRRMALLEGRAKDLDGMLRVAPEDAPPSLVIVVDEFATLVKEIPDFVAGIVDIAQRGRSLGIHLVLATQRSGAVNDNILANTNLRIALRVLDPSDSTAVIGAKDAAEIPVPLRGRAFARTGPGALSAFQCAWSGAPFEAGAQASPAVVHPFPFTAAATPGADADEDELTPRRRTAKRHAPVRADAPSGPAPSPPTQLQVVIRACGDAAVLTNSDPPRRPWVEPLPEQVSLAQVLRSPEGRKERAADPGRHVVLGVGDAPQEQAQFVVSVDLEASGGLVVFGTGGSGKTTLLRTVAAGLVQQGGPDGVRLYVLDFAGRSLSQLAALPHTVAVATGDDLEQVTRMLTALRVELESRRRLLAEARAESVSALRRQARATVLPRLILLLDGYAGFHAAFEPGHLYGWVTDLQRLVTEGRQVGLHVVLTANRELGVPTALTSAMGSRVVLRMTSAEELIGLGVPRDAAKGTELGDGRAFIDGGTEIQVATVGDDPSGAGQADALATLARELAHRGTQLAPRLLELPEDAVLPKLRPALLRCPMGLADLTLEPVEVDLRRQNLLVVGPPSSGRTSALARVVLGLAAKRGGPALIGLGGLTSPLASLDQWDVRGFGRANQSAALDVATALVAGYEGNDVKVVLVIDSVEDVESMENNPRLDGLLRSDAVRVAAVADAPTLGQAYSGWVAALKRNRVVLVLQPGSAGEVEAIAGVKPGLRPGQTFPPGRGVLVDHGQPRLVQVAAPHSPSPPRAVAGTRAPRKAAASPKKAGQKRTL